MHNMIHYIRPNQMIWCSNTYTYIGIAAYVIKWHELSEILRWILDFVVLKYSRVDTLEVGHSFILTTFIHPALRLACSQIAEDIVWIDWYMTANRQERVHKNRFHCESFARLQAVMTRASASGHTTSGLGFSSKWFLGWLKQHETMTLARDFKVKN